MKTLLSLETSCDECSASVIAPADSPSQVRVLSNVIFSQIELHSKFGGIVPEVASRNHLEMFAPVVDEALSTAGIRFKDLSAVGVTQGPGLMGALLVGLSAAKAYSYSLNIPLIPVHHLEGHLHSLFIESQKNVPLPQDMKLPMLVCLVSGGHTNLYLLESLPPESLRLTELSKSRDDAAGEAFDKCAKILGLPYPGGIHIDSLARKGRKDAFAFPRPLPGQNLEFSFSGLKTAVQTEVKKLGFTPHVFGKINSDQLPKEEMLFDLCASVQEAIVQTLVRKIILAKDRTDAQSIAIVGGVSANSRLRELLSHVKLPVYMPDAVYCTDNAAMIGACAYFKWIRNEVPSAVEASRLNAFSS